MKKTIQKIKNNIKSKYVKKADFKKLQAQLEVLEKTVASLTNNVEQTVIETEAVTKKSSTKKISKPESKKTVKTSSASAQSKPVKKVSAKKSPAKKKSKPETTVKTSSAGAQSKAVKKVAAESTDNLKKIKGIGTVLENKLKALDINRIAQIASWNEADIEQISNHLNFKGRIERDQWVSQAKVLMGEQS